MDRGVEGRLRKLEEQAGKEMRGLTEEQEKERWLQQMRFERGRLEQEETPADVVHARGLIALFRTQYLLPGMGTDELIDRILRWNPVPAGGRSRTTVEREVALAIHRREPGTEGMACPPAWRASFAACEAIARAYSAAPDVELAALYARLDLVEEGDEEARDTWDERFWEVLGVEEGVVLEAVGPDAGEIPEEEASRRIAECWADSVYGEKGYRVARHVERLARSRPVAPAGGEGGS